MGIARALTAVVTGTLLLLPALPAGAAGSAGTGPQSPAGGVGVLAIPLTPGRHVVPAQPAAAAGIQADDVSAAAKGRNVSAAAKGRNVSAAAKGRNREWVAPRVSCGDRAGRTGGFDGWLGWGGNGNSKVPAYIEVDGRLWNSCSGPTYLYLAYDNFTSHHNPQIGSVGRGGNVKVAWHRESDWATFGHIAITVCTRSNGWRCGRPVHV